MRSSSRWVTPAEAIAALEAAGFRRYPASPINAEHCVALMHAPSGATTPCESSGKPPSLNVLVYDNRKLRLPGIDPCTMPALGLHLEVVGEMGGRWRWLKSDARLCLDGVRSAGAELAAAWEGIAAAVRSETLAQRLTDAEVARLMGEAEVDDGPA